MNKLLLVVLVAFVGLLLLSAGLIPSPFAKAPQPIVVETPPTTPEGTVYWADATWEFQHQFIDNEGKGEWSLSHATAVTDLASTYMPHEIVVWEKHLTDGNPWNYEGTCALEGRVQLYYVSDNGQGRKDLDAWEPGAISFPCNQGASGTLTLRAPTFFIKEALPGESFFNYHADFTGTVSFKASNGYSEVNHFSQTGPVFCLGALCENA